MRNSGKSERASDRPNEAPDVTAFEQRAAVGNKLSYDLHFVFGLPHCFHFSFSAIVPLLSNSAMPNPATHRRHFSTLLFVLALVCGVSLVLLRTRSEVQRVEYLSQIPEWSSDTPAIDASSPTGYLSGQRVSIVPGHDRRSFETIAITQEMFAQHKAWIDRTEQANTPLGHPIHLPSLYPWVLGATASFHQHLGGGSIGRCVETAALRLNPNLLLIGLCLASIFTAYRFGRSPGALLSVAMAMIFPFAAGFAPNAPHPLSLHTLCMLFSLLTLFAGTIASPKVAANPTNHQNGRPVAPQASYIASGILAGLGLWLDVSSTLPFVGGLFAAGLLLSFSSRDSSQPTLPWRSWGVAGAGVVLLGYFVDFFPERGDEALRYAHPLYALAWVGAAEILEQCSTVNSGAKKWNPKRWVLCGIASVALLQLPVSILLSKTALYLPDNPDALKLEPLSAIAAPNLAGWLTRDGFSLTALATLLPLLLVPFATFILFKSSSMIHRFAIGLALGPVLPCLWLGSKQLSYWGHLDVALLALVVALVTALFQQSKLRWAWAAAIVFVLSLTPSLTQLLRSTPAGASLSAPEFESYVERDLAHWLSQHSVKTPAVLAPPRVTSGLSFYGGFAGLGTFDRDNQAGTAAAIRIVSASSLEEAATLVEARKLTHIIIPFWDPYLNTYLQLGLGKEAGKERLETSFLSVLQRWEVPLWLRAIPYRLPPGQGVDGPIIIFEVVDEQAPAVADARLVEYFLEMDMLGKAREHAQNLTKYPNDWGALAMACTITAATNDVPGLSAAREKLFSALERPERRRLAWDRRVSLAIALAQQKRPDLAKTQIEKCLAEISTDNLRSLTTVSLYRFHLLCKAYGLAISDPGLQTLSRALLRPDLRARL